MQFELDKTDLINLVNYVKPSMEDCIKEEELNYMKFTGNQHNPNWEWNQEFLNALNENELYKLYLQYKKVSK